MGGAVDLGVAGQVQVAPALAQAAVRAHSARRCSLASESVKQRPRLLRLLEATGEASASMRVPGSAFQLSSPRLANSSASISRRSASATGRLVSGAATRPTVPGISILIVSPAAHTWVEMILGTGRCLDSGQQIIDGFQWLVLVT